MKSSVGDQRGLDGGARSEELRAQIRRHEATDLDPFMLKYAMAVGVNVVQAHSEKERVWRGPYR
jgi:hypothetical protein